MKIVIPLVPPSVNSYVRHTRKGGHYVTPDAKAFKEAVAIFAAGKSVDSKRYEVGIAVFRGKGDRGDCDNYAKVCLDGLVAAGAIRSDDAIDKLTVTKHRDRENPRTEITVEAL